MPCFEPSLHLVLTDQIALICVVDTCLQEIEILGPLRDMDRDRITNDQFRRLASSIGKLTQSAGENVSQPDR